MADLPHIRPRTDNTELVTKYLAWMLMFALRALMMMYVAAAVYKRFDVFAAIGFMEALAWSAGYALVKGLWSRDEGK